MPILQLCKLSTESVYLLGSSCTSDSLVLSISTTLPHTMKSLLSLHLIGLQ